jgi:hypothetical protein
MAYKDKDKPDDPVLLLGLVGLVLLVILIMVWVISSVKLVKFWVPVFRGAARMWEWVPVIGMDVYLELRMSAAKFLIDPKAVSAGDFLQFGNKCLIPLGVLVSIGFAIWVLKTLSNRRADVVGKLDSQHLARQLSAVFTSVIPTLHLTKSLVNDSDPKWRRQTFPEDVFLRTQVRGQPMIDGASKVFREDLAQEYFEGLVRNDKGVEVPHKETGLWVSRTLGRQAVDLIKDARAKAQKKQVVFADRFSPEGKVIFALFAAHAFGDEAGKKDFCKYRDMLNRSCAGAAHGMANLTLAQPLFDRYRSHPLAQKLFAIHHWEYTYLYALVRLAKKQGKCGHWEVMWLKPTNRVLFYVINTVGRLTPHTESAAVFFQSAFEIACAKAGTLPLRKDPRRQHPVPSVLVRGAVQGLAAAYARWRDGTEDDENWWKSDDVWKRAIDRSADFDLKAPAIPAEKAVSDEFDLVMAKMAESSSAHA